MNDTTVMGASASPADVLDYVGAVRAWLGDLPPEEVDDLTAGMEADLAERAAETGARLGDLLGQPEEYAAELRAAAGLPPRSASTRYGDVARIGVVGEIALAVRSAGTRTVERWPWLRDLRPVWWVARGVALGGIVAAVLGGGRFLLMLLGAALSFWAGRVLAAREGGRGPGVFVLLVNGVAALALVPVAVWLLAPPTVYVDDGASADTGVWVSGGQAGNLYVYDAAGNRVEGARIFDQFGQPVTLDPSAVSVETGADGEAMTWPPDPGTLSVFPLHPGDPDAWAGTQGWVPPVSISPLVGGPAASVTPSPSPSASPSAEVSPSPSASAPPSVPPTPTPTP